MSDGFEVDEFGTAVDPQDQDPDTQDHDASADGDENHQADVRGDPRPSLLKWIRGGRSCWSSGCSWRRKLRHGTTGGADDHRPRAPAGGGLRARHGCSFVARVHGAAP